jgi:hypothetical protein
MNKGVKMTRHLIAVAIIFSLSAQTLAPKKKDVIYPIPKTSGEGHTWMGWNSERRENFVIGFLSAYQIAFRTGCLEYSFADPPKDALDLEKSPLQKCMLQQLSFSKLPEYYAREITSFYERYPSDSDVPTSWLILAFSDSENKTFEQVHAGWTSGHASP